MWRMQRTSAEGIARERFLVTAWLLLVLASFSLGVWAFLGYQNASSKPEERDRGVWGAAYRTLQLYVLNSGDVDPPMPWPLEAARFGAPIVGLLGIGGLLRRAFTKSPRGLSGHTIVCGLGSKGLVLARKLRRTGAEVVCIEEDETNRNIDAALSAGMFIVEGDAQDKHTLVGAGVRRAHAVIVVTSDPALNVRIAGLAAELSRYSGVRARLRRLRRAGAPVPPNILVHASGRDPGFVRLAEENYHIRCLDLFDRAACMALEQARPFEGGSRATGQPRVVLCGQGPILEELAANIIVKWREIWKKEAIKLRLTVIGAENSKVLAEVSRVAPDAQQYCEISDLHAVAPDMIADLLEPVVQEAPSGSLAPWTAFVCDSADGSTIQLAVQIEKIGAPVRLRVAALLQQPEADLGMLTVQVAESRRLRLLRTLDLALDPAIAAHDVVEHIARKIHERYVRMQEMEGRTPELNPSMLPWAHLPETLKNSNRGQALDIDRKLRRVGARRRAKRAGDTPTPVFSAQEIEAMAEMEHERWIRERLDAGWKYSDVFKDIGVKISPYLVPWSKLGEAEKEWDREFARSIPEILKSAGYHVERTAAQEPTA